MPGTVDATQTAVLATVAMMTIVFPATRMHTFTAAMNVCAIPAIARLQMQATALLLVMATATHAQVDAIKTSAHHAAQTLFLEVANALAPQASIPILML